MDGMEPLRDEFSEHYELAGLPGDFKIEFTDEDVPEDRQATCIRCHRKSLEIIDTTVFMLEDLPGHRFICGKCFFELDVVAREEVE